MFAGAESPASTRNARSSVAWSGTSKGTSTAPPCLGCRPAARTSSSSTPGCPTAGGSGAEGSGAGPGTSARSGPVTAVSSRSSGRAQLQTATRPPRWTTRAASASAVAKSAANCSALNAVTTSKRPSSHGRRSIGPTRRSAAGTRRRAMSIIPSAASIPLTVAPRAAARRQNSPLPHPTRDPRAGAGRGCARHHLAGRVGEPRPELGPAGRLGAPVWTLGGRGRGDGLRHGSECARISMCSGGDPRRTAHRGWVGALAPAYREAGSPPR